MSVNNQYIIQRRLVSLVYPLLHHVYISKVEASQLRYTVKLSKEEMSKATFCVLLVLMVLCSTTCTAQYPYARRARMAQRPVAPDVQYQDGWSITLML